MRHLGVSPNLVLQLGIAWALMVCVASGVFGAQSHPSIVPVGLTALAGAAWAAIAVRIERGAWVLGAVPAAAAIATAGFLIGVSIGEQDAGARTGALVPWVFLTMCLSVGALLAFGAVIGSVWRLVAVVLTRRR
jgi:hypothetical protein